MDRITRAAMAGPALEEILNAEKVEMGEITR